MEGRFLARDNRFRVTAEIDGRQIWAHLPHPGRLGELLLPGRRAILVERRSPGRLTHYDLAMVRAEGQWVSVAARLPVCLDPAWFRQGANA